MHPPSTRHSARHDQWPMKNKGKWKNRATKGKTQRGSRSSSDLPRKYRAASASRCATSAGWQPSRRRLRSGFRYFPGAAIREDRQIVRHTRIRAQGLDHFRIKRFDILYRTPHFLGDRFDEAAMTFENVVIRNAGIGQIGYGARHRAAKLRIPMLAGDRRAGHRLSRNCWVAKLHVNCSACLRTVVRSRRSASSHARARSSSSTPDRRLVTTSRGPATG